jgi:hypothetical protein
MFFKNVLIIISLFPKDSHNSAHEEKPSTNTFHNFSTQLAEKLKELGAKYAEIEMWKETERKVLVLFACNVENMSSKS